MPIYIFFLAAVIPPVMLAIYYYKQDKAKPEPKGLIVKIFILGILSTIPAIIMELLVTRLQPLFAWNELLFYAFEAFIVASLCEELIKLFVVKKFAFKNKAFDEITDGIVYTVIASLGFACMENIMYVFQEGLATAILRAFTAVPMHATASGIMGYYIGKSRFAPTIEEASFLTRKGFLIAFFIHGLYDFVLFAEPVLGTIVSLTIFPILIYSFVKLRKLIKQAIKEDKAAGRVGDPLDENHFNYEA